MIERQKLPSERRIVKFIFQVANEQWNWVLNYTTYHCSEDTGQVRQKEASDFVAGVFQSAFQRLTEFPPDTPLPGMKGETSDEQKQLRADWLRNIARDLLIKKDPAKNPPPVSPKLTPPTKLTPPR